MGMKIIALLLLLLPPFAAQAGLYKYTDDKGETIYSDKAPFDGADEVKLPAIQVTPAVKYTPKKKAETEDDNADSNKTVTRYKRFKITRPVGGAAMRNNAGQVDVKLALQPKLDVKAGHRIDFLLDGRVIKAASKLSTLTIKNMERGEHHLQARIKDKQGKILKSTATIKFTLHRFSKLHRNGS